MMKVVFFLTLAFGAHAETGADYGWPLCVQSCVADDYANPCTITDMSCASSCDAVFIANEIRPYCFYCGSDYPNWLNYCIDKGYCFYGASTVSVLKAGSSSEAEVKQIRDLKVGDKILAKDMSGHSAYKTVKALPHSRASEDYVEVKMGKGQGEEIKATLHHTFPTCSGKSKMAKQLKSGDCLMTPNGKDYVHKAMRVPAQKGDDTFTVEMEAGVQEIAVGGIFTHTKAIADAKPQWVTSKKS
jgi:hypothetical protein